MNNKFLAKMKDLLKEDYEAYINTLDIPAYRGMRVNTLKVSVDDFLQYPFINVRPTAFCKESFYIDTSLEGIGNHPYHLSGLFYMQEPSASSAVEVLDVKKGDWVLDLCAAPGGKSSQIAAKLHNTGFLVSNEIDHGRANILLSNLERMGVSENMITSANPKAICEEMAGCFDKILVDAPCSGEGMFKKNSKAINEWSEEHVLSCAHRQLHILESAYGALKKDGILVYSTCTYSIEENEQVVYEFLKAHEDLELLDCAVTWGREGIAYLDLDVRKVRRILPMDEGEGHFIAKFCKRVEADCVKLKEMKNAKIESFVSDFLHSQLTQLPAHYMILQDKVYMKHSPFYQLKNIKVLRQGIYCGDSKKNRLEPHQHFYTSAILDDKRKVVVDMNDKQCLQFLEGNVVDIAGVKGYAALAYHGHIIGYGKGDGTVIKNKYPKGLRCKGKLTF